MRQGVRFGIDVGKSRIGVAKCDPEALLATPVATLQRESNWLDHLKQLLSEQHVLECVVGLPISLSGKHTASTEDSIDVAREIEQSCGVMCRLVDERFSTTEAHESMKRIGKSQKQSRDFIDQVAAVNILQYALDSEKNTGEPAGVALTHFSD